MSRERRALPISEGGVAAELGVNSPKRTRPVPPAVTADEDESELRRAMSVRALPGRRGAPTGRIRWYHQGERGECWAFTVTRTAHEDWERGRPLDSKGATYPDGQPVVPQGLKPSDVPLRCGTCHTETVEFLQLVFYAE